VKRINPPLQEQLIEFVRALGSPDLAVGLGLRDIVDAIDLSHDIAVIAEPLLPLTDGARASPRTGRGSSSI
jgi:hypothetical protein